MSRLFHSECNTFLVSTRCGLHVSAADKRRVELICDRLGLRHIGSKIQTASKEWLQENTSKLLAVPAMVPAGVVAGVLSDSTAENPAPQTAGQAVTTRLQQTNGPMADTANCSETLAGNLTASASGAMVRELFVRTSTAQSDCY